GRESSHAGFPWHGGFSASPHRHNRRALAGVGRADAPAAPPPRYPAAAGPGIARSAPHRTGTAPETATGWVRASPPAPSDRRRRNWPAAFPALSAAAYGAGSASP